MKGEAHHKQWSQTEKKFLLQNMHLSTDKLSEALGRTGLAIQQKISKLTPAGTRVKRKQEAKQATFHFSKDPLQDIIDKGVAVHNKVLSPIEVSTEVSSVIKGIEKDPVTELVTPPEVIYINLDSMKVTINGKTQRIDVDFKTSC